MKEYLQERIECCKCEVEKWQTRKKAIAKTSNHQGDLNTCNDTIIRWLGSKEEAERILEHLEKDRP